MISIGARSFSCQLKRIHQMHTIPTGIEYRNWSITYTYFRSNMLNERTCYKHGEYILEHRSIQAVSIILNCRRVYSDIPLDSLIKQNSYSSLIPHLYKEPSYSKYPIWKLHKMNEKRNFRNSQKMGEERIRQMLKIKMK